MAQKNAENFNEEEEDIDAQLEEAEQEVNGVAEPAVSQTVIAPGAEAPATEAVDAEEINDTFTVFKQPSRRMIVNTTNGEPVIDLDDEDGIGIALAKILTQLEEIRIATNA